MNKADAAVPLTPLQRTQALRERRAELGLTRLEVYAHPDDHEQIKKLAARLRRKREKAAAK